MRKHLTLIIAVLLVISLGANAYLLAYQWSWTADQRKEAVTVKQTTTVRETVTVYATLTVTTKVVHTETVRAGVHYPLKVSDFMNREVVIASRPQRVVSCSPSNTEILAVLGLLDTVVGVDEFSDFPPEVRKMKAEGRIKSVGGIVDLSIERILELKPDVVFVSADIQGRFVPLLEEKGLVVVALSADSITDIYRGILLVGEVMGVREKSLEVINGIRERIERVQTELAHVKYKRSVIGIIWLEPIWTFGDDTFLNDIITLAGGYNPFVDSRGWFMTGPEAVVTRNPEVILITAMSIGLKPEEVLEKVKNIEGLSATDAVKNDRVYLLHGQAENILVRPGPRVGEAVELIARILYPEVFGGELPRILGDDYSKHLSKIAVQAVAG